MSKRTPRRCSSLDRGRGLAGEHLDRLGAAERRGRRRGCPRRGARASRRRPAPRPARPGPRSSSSRRAACARPGRPGRPRSAASKRDVAGRPRRRRPPRRRTRCGSVAGAKRAVTVPGAVAALPRPPVLARARHRAPPRERRAPARDRGGARARAGWLGARAGRGAGGDARAARCASTPPAHIDAIEAFCARGGGMIDMDTVASAGLLRGGAARRRRRGARRPSGCSPATTASPSAACARPATTPSATGRWASACSTTSPSPPRTRSPSCGAERVLVLDWDVHHGNGTEEIFADSDRGALREHPPVRRSIPGTGAGRVRGRGRGRGLHGQPAGAARARAATSSWRWSQHVVAPDRARASSPGLIAISAGYDAHRDDPLA